MPFTVQEKVLDLVMKRIALLSFALIASTFPVMAHETANISCETVRAYVAQVGVAQAKAMALSAGMTSAQERLAKRCLARKI